MKYKFFAQSVVAGLSLMMSHVGDGLAASQPSPRRIEVTATKFSFSPSEITLKKGDPIVLVLTSRDVTHGLKFKELNLDTEINKNATGELAFTPTKAGDFVGHCSRFCGAGHGSMTLTLHVTE